MSSSHQLFKENVKEKRRKVLARIKHLLLWKSPDHADPHPYAISTRIIEGTRDAMFVATEPYHIGGQQHRLPATENFPSEAKGQTSDRPAFTAPLINHTGVNSAGAGKAETDTDQTMSKLYLHTSQGEFFAGAQNITIYGGTYINASSANNTSNTLPDLPSILPRKPNVSSLFTGQRDVLDKLKNHFTPSISGKSGS
ncbi:hypothetical protein BYT27DRAFT_7251515 [Phlegmacium glaucopus]|nr:hypothetical protein BYT27DRAFT_7251515 [Phlegmacium glaucopus]